MSLIECKNLVMNYENKVAVDDVSFTIEKGDYLCIVGENGSGKTTLMKGILGLKKYNSGNIEYNIKRNEIGYLPQQTIIQKDFPASVYEVILSGCLNRSKFNPFFSKQQKNVAKENMERLGISNLAKKSYRDLSGGQQQRVLLARALCATGELLVLDEPVTALDPIATTDMYDIIQSLNRDNGITIVMISHDIDSAIVYGNKIIHMGNKMEFFGSTNDYVLSNSYRRMLKKIQ
ncbi:MAG: ABC transporter ATP-binding protein [Ruminococcus sp.]|nr:ABC transporter ATP-binding protein [Ruminococcus sp.]MCD7801091.1 ABC transporter ATP-binding protein [Ruminococcus sp.]